MFCKREYSIKCRGEKGGCFEENNEKGKGLQFLNMEEMCFLDGLQGIKHKQRSNNFKDFHSLRPFRRCTGRNASYVLDLTKAVVWQSW